MISRGADADVGFGPRLRAGRQRDSRDSHRADTLRRRQNPARISDARYTPLRVVEQVTRGPASTAVVFYTGKLSCFLAGISTCLFFSIASARASRRRVECGMITSSI